MLDDGNASSAAENQTDASTSSPRAYPIQEE